MNCHRCEYAAEIADGKNAVMAFDKTPCSECQLKENSAFVIEYKPSLEKADLSGVRRQGLRAGEAPMEYDDEPEALKGGTGESGEVRLPISVLREALATILMLEPDTRDVVCFRFTGDMTYGDIALTQGVTAAAVEARHKRALEQNPILGALFPVKIAKQARRKPHARRSAA